MKTQAQIITEYIQQLEKLLEKSNLIKQELKRHIKFSKLQKRIDAIFQQLQFIRSYVFPKTAKEKAEYYKHNKLALALIQGYINEIKENDDGETTLDQHKEQEEAWHKIEEQHEQILADLEHAEAALQEAESASDEKEREKIDRYETGIAELADSTEALSAETEAHSHSHETIFEEIHHLHIELQFIKLNAFARNHAYESHELNHDSESHHQLEEFLRHHYESMQEINSHLFELTHHYEHMLEELDDEEEETLQLETLQEKIKRTMELLEDEAEEHKTHQHSPSMHTVPVDFEE